MLQFEVSGMTCGHCVHAVTRAVQGVDPSARVTVDLEAGEVKIESSATGAAERFAQAMTEAGYGANRIPGPA